MSSILGQCEFLKKSEDKRICYEYENCPRMLSNDDKRVLLDSLSGKIKDFGESLENFLLNSEFDKIDLDSYFYAYYRKFDCLLYWADIHLHQIME